MFRKVLVVDDIDFNDIAAIQVLNELKVPQIEYVKYCDEALLKIRKAHADGLPYQLLITDLSFKPDHREEKLKSGEDLIEAVKKLYHEIKIIAFSIEDKPYRIKSLFDKYDIDGFVMKGRKSMPDLKKAIQNSYNNNKKYLSAELDYVLQDKTNNEIDNFDILIIKHLSQGIQQENIGDNFKELGITPNSKSTIEKRIAKLKDFFKANNTVHLVAIAKDMGIV
jgi:DNA-binding NarL/FixJ family response regulator